MMGYLPLFHFGHDPSCVIAHLDATHIVTAQEKKIIYRSLLPTLANDKNKQQTMLSFGILQCWASK